MTAEAGISTRTGFRCFDQYLHRWAQWYDPTRLVDLDILITMLGAYDSAKASRRRSLRSEDFLYSAAGGIQSRRACLVMVLGLEIGSIAALEPTLGHYDLIRV